MLGFYIAHCDIGWCIKGFINTFDTFTFTMCRILQCSTVLTFWTSCFLLSNILNGKLFRVTYKSPSTDPKLCKLVGNKLTLYFIGPRLWQRFFCGFWKSSCLNSSSVHIYPIKVIYYRHMAMASTSTVAYSHKSNVLLLLQASVVWGKPQAERDFIWAFSNILRTEYIHDSWTQNVLCTPFIFKGVAKHCGIHPTVSVFICMSLCPELKPSG